MKLLPKDFQRQGTFFNYGKITKVVREKNLDWNHANKCGERKIGFNKNGFNSAQ